MKILGLDLSTRESGWAIYNKKLKYGSFKTPYKLKGVLAMEYQATKIKELIEKEKPKKIIIEDTFLGKYNPYMYKTISRLGGWVGLKSYFDKRNYCYVMACKARKKVGIKGNASKKEIIKKLKELFNIEVKNHNIADAIVLVLSETKNELEK